MIALLLLAATTAKLPTGVPPIIIKEPVYEMVPYCPQGYELYGYSPSNLIGVGTWDRTIVPEIQDPTNPYYFWIKTDTPTTVMTQSYSKYMCFPPEAK